MRRYNKKLRSIILFLVGALLVLFINFKIVENNLKPTILAMAEAKARQIATRTINDAINTRVVTNVEYTDLVYVHKDNRGRVVMMQPNTIKINKIASETTLEVQRSLQALKEEGFYIPLGQVLGSQLLASYGPEIHVRIVPIGTVQTEVVDEFAQAGINQTRHMLYLKVKSMVRIVVPLVSADVQVVSTVPIAETIILGVVSLRNYS
ncbi:MAG: sporulation protein YunB [Firmicutes bacterium]|nr:sporulation protein YunB [Bacillota bacterium]